MGLSYGGGVPVRLIASDIAAGDTIAAGSTFYFPIAQSGFYLGFGSTYGAITYQTPGILSKLFFEKIAGTLATTMTGEVNINGSTGNQAITFTSTNGIYEDITHTDTVNVGDSVAYKFVAAGTGTSLGIESASALFQATDPGGGYDTVNVLCCFGGGGIPVSTTSATLFSAMVQRDGLNDTTQATHEWLVSLPPGVDHVTIRNLGIRMNFNSNANAVTISVNGASGSGTAPTITINAGATGTFSDTVNQIQAKNGDKLSFKIVTGAGTVSCAPNSISVEVQSDNNVWHYITSEEPIAAGSNPAFRAIGGRNNTNTTESFTQMRHGIPNTVLSLLSCYISTATASTLLKLRANGADKGAPATMQIDTSQAANAWYTDKVNHYAPDPNDLLNLTTTGSATGPQLIATVVTVQGNIAPTPLPNYQATETSGAGGWVGERAFRL